MPRTIVVNSFPPFLKEHNIVLLTPLPLKYDKDFIVDTICLKCNGKCSKSVSAVMKTNSFCKICMKEIAGKKRIETNLKKYNCKYSCENKDVIAKKIKTNMERYQCEHTLQNKEIQKKTQDTIMKKYNVKCTLQVPEIKEKARLTTQSNFGVDNSLQNPQVREKIRLTNQRIYGINNPSQNPQVKEKARLTNQRNLGVDYPLQNPQVREKARLTNQRIYGSVCSLQNPQVKEKARLTNQRNLGVDYPLQSPVIREKIRLINQRNLGVDTPLESKVIRDKGKETMLSRYGALYSMHIPNILHKIHTSSYLFRNYTLPSSRIVEYQGFENLALDELLLNQKIPEENVVNMGLHQIKFTMLDIYPFLTSIDSTKKYKKYGYTPDIFIISQKKFIEVKSTYTLTFKTHIIFVKQCAIKRMGFDCEIWVYDAKGNRVQTYI